MFNVNVQYHVRLNRFQDELFHDVMLTLDLDDPTTHAVISLLMVTKLSKVDGDSTKTQIL